MIDEEMWYISWLFTRWIVNDIYYKHGILLMGTNYEYIIGSNIRYDKVLYKKIWKSIFYSRNKKKYWANNYYNEYANDFEKYYSDVLNAFNTKNIIPYKKPIAG